MVQYKVLGQSTPTATTETNLYTVPLGRAGVVSSVVVCNRGVSTETFRISISVAGGVTGNKDYIYYNVEVPSQNTFVATIGLTLSATDIVRIYASSGNLSFSLYGSEIF